VSHLKDDRLINRGLKSTVPRLKILQLLESMPSRHLSAEEVCSELSKKGDDVALATIYRVLNQFVEAGLVIRHNFEGDFCVYELDTGEHHDHLVCNKCTRVVEFFDDTIENQQIRIAEENGFELTDHRLVIYGLCESCR
jgi:Fur family transcriptional regulator, ferric uptake regulator